VSSRAWLTSDERLDSGGRHGEATLVATRDDQQVSSHCLARQLNAAALLPTTKEDKGAYSLSEAQRRTPTFRMVPDRE
jgi:hypothetical protein